MSRIANHHDSREDAVAREARARLRRAQEAADLARESYFAAGRDTLAERQRAFDEANSEELEARLASSEAENGARMARQQGERRRPAPVSRGDLTEA